MKKITTLFTLGFTLIATSLVAQSRHYDARSLGMGGGGTAYADGYHANFINPANLMINSYHRNTSIGLMGGLGVKAGGNLANISVYNKYLTNGQVIEGTVRENMLNDWFGTSSQNSRELSMTFSLVPLGVSHKRSKQAFSFASRVRMTTDFSISKGFAELLFYGLDPEVFGNTPVPVNFSQNSVAYAEFSFGYAREIISLPDMFFAKDIKLYVGAAPKYLYGVYTGGINFNSTLMMNNAGSSNMTINHDFSYTLQTIGDLSTQLQNYEQAYSQNSDAELGDYVDYSGGDIGSAQASGFGLDLGGTLEMDVSSLPIPLFVDKEKTLRISMSLTDLGKLKFDNNASNVFAEGNFEYTGATAGDNVNGYFDNLSDSLQNDVYGQFNSENIEAVEYSLPGMYNFGASLEMGNLLAALDYGFGFNTNGVNSRRSVLNLGLQYRALGIIPLRVGMRMGGYSSVSYSAGFGVDVNVFEFSVGVSNVANSEKFGSSGGFAWSGLIVRF